jgi:hypothetical protein
MNTLRSVEHCISITVSAAKLFAIYCQVDEWAAWDPETKSAYLSAPLKEGAKGRLTPRKGRPVPMLLTVYLPNKEFTVEASVLGSKMIFVHAIEVLAESPARVKAIHRVTFTGWLAPILYATVGKLVDRTLPETLGRLKAHAERANPAMK